MASTLCLNRWKWRRNKTQSFHFFSPFLFFFFLFLINDCLAFTSFHRHSYLLFIDCSSTRTESECDKVSHERDLNANFRLHAHFLSGFILSFPSCDGIIRLNEHLLFFPACNKTLSSRLFMKVNSHFMFSTIPLYSLLARWTIRGWW